MEYSPLQVMTDVTETNFKMFSAYDSFGTHSEDPVGLEVLTDLDHLIFQQKARHIKTMGSFVNFVILCQ